MLGWYTFERSSLIVPSDGVPPYLWVNLFRCSVYSHLGLRLGPYVEHPIHNLRCVPGCDGQLRLQTLFLGLPSETEVSLRWVPTAVAHPSLCLCPQGLLAQQGQCLVSSDLLISPRPGPTPPPYTVLHGIRPAVTSCWLLSALCFLDHPSVITRSHPGSHSHCPRPLGQHFGETGKYP